MNDALNSVKDKLVIVLNLILKYRYIIALVVFALMVICKVNFSSIDAWAGYIYNGDQYTGTVLGEARGIRSDEWLVQTPYAFSQSLADGYYELYNENIGQGSNMVFGEAPVFDITILARPLQWGYLLFGAEYGFSWYWSLKIVMLFMVSLELVLILSRKDKLLSIAGAIWLALSPCLMWWLSTSIADAYIYGGIIVVLFSYYMNNLTHITFF